MILIKPILYMEINIFVFRDLMQETKSEETKAQKICGYLIFFTQTLYIVNWFVH